MDSMLASHFAGLSTRGKVMAEYIWLGGSGSDLRSATKVLSFKPSSPADVPLWTCDGVATGQEDGPCSVVYLKARSIHPDPLRCFKLRGRFPALLNAAAKGGFGLAHVFLSVYQSFDASHASLQGAEVEK